MYSLAQFRNSLGRGWRIRWPVATAAALLVLLAGAALWQFSQAHSFAGVAKPPQSPAPEITLTDDRGAVFQLSALRGRWVLLAYGYTHCPDVCPLTLSNLNQALQLLGAGAGDVRVVFVSVDPERDTVPVMHDYVTHFNPNFTGLTGTAGEVAVAAQAYGVRYEKVATTSASGYAVSHSAYVYLIDPQFNWRLTYPFGVTPEEIAGDLRYLMQHPG